MRASERMWGLSNGGEEIRFPLPPSERELRPKGITRATVRDGESLEHPRVIHLLLRSSTTLSLYLTTALRVYSPRIKKKKNTPLRLMNLCLYPEIYVYNFFPIITSRGKNFSKISLTSYIFFTRRKMSVIFALVILHVR